MTCLAGLKKSHLLFRWLGSTVPGFIEVGDGGARCQVELGWAAICQFPDPGKNFGPRGFAALLMLNQFLDIAAELVEYRVAVPPLV